MRQELIDQTQDMAATVTTALDSILSLRTQQFEEIDRSLDDSAQANRISVLDKELRDLDLASGQIRIYLLDFQPTLTNIQVLARGNLEIASQFKEIEKLWLFTMTKVP